MSLARLRSKKPPVAREEKRRNICNFLPTDFCVAYTKCIATLWHELIFVWLTRSV